MRRVGEVVEKESVRPPALLIVGKVTEMGKRLGWYEKLPLKGKTVIVTRSMPRNSRLAGFLEENGARVIQAPSIEIRPPESFEELDTALRSLAEFDWVVFTSPNGADSVASRLGELGLDAMDRRYLRCIAENYGGGPVGVETLAAALSEERDAIEEVIEPFLIQQGLVQRTPRGRLLTKGGFGHIGLTATATVIAQLDLLTGETEEDGDAA